MTNIKFLVKIYDYLAILHLFSSDFPFITIIPTIFRKSTSTKLMQNIQGLVVLWIWQLLLLLYHNLSNPWCQWSAILNSFTNFCKYFIVCRYILFMSYKSFESFSILPRFFPQIAQSIYLLLAIICCKFVVYILHND